MELKSRNVEPQPSAPPTAGQTGSEPEASADLTRRERILDRRRKLRATVLIVTDLASLFLSGFLAYLAWARPVQVQDPWLYLPLAPLFLVFVLAYAQAGLYPGFGLGPVETLRRLSLVTTYGFLVLAGFIFALKLPHLYSRATFAIAYLLALLLLPLARLGMARMASRWSWWQEPVLLVGPRVQAQQVLRELSDAPQLGYQAEALYTTGGDSAPSLLSGVPVHTTEPDPQRHPGVRVVFLLTEEPPSQGLDRLHHDFRHVVIIRPYQGLPVEGIQVRNLGRLLGIEYTSNLLMRRNRVLKRTMDLLLGTFLLLLALPLVLVSALLVIAVDPGWPFFAQRRAGLQGVPFAVHKVRTMYRDAEARLEEHLGANPELRRQWKQRMKLSDDPRVLPGAGLLLRRFSLDELPQLWSVVKGDMSLVGPRPFPKYHLDLFSPEFRALRQRVRPGITGLWQVTVRSEGGIAEQEAYDSYYIRNWSLWLDLYILGRTLGAVLRGKGAY